MISDLCIWLNLEQYQEFLDDEPDFNLFEMAENVQEDTIPNNILFLDDLFALEEVDYGLDELFEFIMFLEGY